MYNNNRQSLNYGRMPNYYPTSTEHFLDSYALNHGYFSQYVRTDIGICFGLESVNLNSGQQILHPTENISFNPKLPNLVNFYEAEDDRKQCNHVLFNQREFPNTFYQNCSKNSTNKCNGFSDRHNLVECYRQDSEHLKKSRNYSLDTIYEQQLATNVSATINSRWNNYNEAVSPKKKWMRNYMMSKNIFDFHL